MRRSPRNLRIAFNHKGLTHFGGVYFFHEFLRVMQFRDFLARHLRYPRRNQRYSTSQMILALVYPIVLGLDRLETASFLRSNGTFQYLTGIESFPDAQTLRRFLLQAPVRLWEQLHGVNDRLLQNFIHLPDHRSRLILDLDSTVVTTFGHQDGAEVGYNPRYRGKRSYHPLLCIEANSSYLWDAELRAGNAGTWDGSVELLDTSFANVPPDIREIRVRADAGFAFNPVLDALESQPARYAVVARLTRPFRNLLPGLRYAPVNRYWEMAEFEHRSHGWRKARRCVVARRCLPDEEGQPTLFTLGRYVYRAWWTDLPLDSRRRVAFLRRPRGHGTAHPGTARGLRFAENPHSFLCRECPLSGDHSPGLQPRHRIPANLPGAQLAILHFAETPLQPLPASR